MHLRDGPLDERAQMALCGDHQAANAALAVACARRLGVWDPEILGRAVVVGLAAARLPGRAEILSRTPWIVIDGAHTEASARALAAVLDQIPRRRAHLVLSVSAGKNLGAILEALLPRFQRVTLTRAEPVRSLDPHQVAAVAGQLAPEGEFRVVPNPHLALRAAQAETGPDALLCAAGSVYLAGIARQILAGGGIATAEVGSKRPAGEGTATGARADDGPR